MFKIGETVIHMRDVCRIDELVKNYRDGEDYYRLSTIDDQGLTIYTPVSNTRNVMRKIMSKQAAKDLIKKIPSIKPLETDGRSLAVEYKDLLNRGTHEDCIKIIKTAYGRNALRIKENKKGSENDKIYFRLAENVLYAEIAVALGMSVKQAREYVVEQVSSMAMPAATPSS